MAPINIWMGRSKEPLTPFLAVILAIFAIVALIVLMCVPFALSALYQEFKDWRACRRSQNAHTFWLSSRKSKLCPALKEVDFMTACCLHKQTRMTGTPPTARLVDFPARGRESPWIACHATRCRTICVYRCFTNLYLLPIFLHDSRHPNDMQKEMDKGQERCNISLHKYMWAFCNGSII